MIVLYLFKMLCDVCFYMAFAAPLAACFGAAGFIYAAILIVPPTIYIIFCTIAKRFDISDYGSIFLAFFKIYIPFVILMLIMKQRMVMEAHSLPYALMFCVGAVLLLRMARHDRQTLSQLRFKLYNLAAVGSVVAVGALLGSERLLHFLAVAIGTLYSKGIAPVILLLLRILLWPLFKLLELIPQQGEEELILNTESLSQILGMEEYETTTAHGTEIIKAVVYLLLALAVIFVIVRLFQWLIGGRSVKDRASGVSEHRVSVDASGKPTGGRRAFNPIRRAYRKFLAACKKGGLSRESYMNSRDIASAASQHFGHEAEIEEIRELYLPVRYGKKEVSREKTARMKELCAEASRAIREKTRSV